MGIVFFLRLLFFSKEFIYFLHGVSFFFCQWFCFFFWRFCCESFFSNNVFCVFFLARFCLFCRRFGLFVSRSLFFFEKKTKKSFVFVFVQGLCVCVFLQGILFFFWGVEGFFFKGFFCIGFHFKWCILISKGSFFFFKGWFLFTIIFFKVFFKKRT